MYFLGSSRYLAGRYEKKGSEREEKSQSTPLLLFLFLFFLFFSSSFLFILEEGVLAPGDALLDVGLGVGKAGRLARLAAKETVQVRAGLVRTALRGKQKEKGTGEDEHSQQEERKKGKKKENGKNTFSTVWHCAQRCTKSFWPFSDDMVLSGGKEVRG
jgi:hypothetical protein